jgi:hypothetical protein
MRRPLRIAATAGACRLFPHFVHDDLSSLPSIHRSGTSFSRAFQRKVANRGQNTAQLLILDDFAGNFFVLKILQRNHTCKLKKQRNLHPK